MDTVTTLLVILMAGVCVAEQQIRVEPRVRVRSGSRLLLRCELVDRQADTTVTQVAWVFTAEGDRRTLGVYNPQLGASYTPQGPLYPEGRVRFREPPSLEAPALEINPVTPTDTGVYSCEMATYPSGNLQGDTNLTVLVAPHNRATPVSVKAGGDTVQAVAECVSEGGKPGALIRWEPDAYNASTVTTRNPDSTYTVTSRLLSLPVAELDKQAVTCVISQPALDRPVRQELTLSVQYPPIVTVSGFDRDWYVGRDEVTLTCETRANPSATEFSWSHNSGPLPSDAESDREVLRLRGVNEQLNGTYTCTATNPLGSGTDTLTVYINESPLPLSGSSTGAIVGGIIAVVVIVAVLVTTFMIFRRHRKNLSDTETESEPPSHKPPPPTKTTEDTREVLVKFSDNGVTESQPLQSVYYETSRENGESEMADVKLFPESPSDDYVEQLNPIYNELSYRESDNSSPGFISKGMYV